MFDATDPETDLTHFLTEDWSATPHHPYKEDVSSNAPAPRCTGFFMIDFADSDHDGASVAHRSRTGFIVFFNSVPIFVHSKKQGGARHTILVLSL